jgi:hypothetical protein
MNEDEIDNELKCAVCQQPFHEPVSSTQCHHTFCKECIIACINQERRCPVCRTHSDYENYQPIKSRALLNQLNRLHVRCNACQIRNIQRVDFQGHTQKCPNWIIPCTAADIRCTWQGMRNQLANHVKNCPFQRIRPIVDDFHGQINNLREQINDLRNTINLFYAILFFAIFLVFMWLRSEQSKQPRSFGEKVRGLFEN